MRDGYVMEEQIFKMRWVDDIPILGSHDDAFNVLPAHSLT